MSGDLSMMSKHRYRKATTEIKILKTIIMVVNVKWCRSNNFISLRPFEIIVKCDLEKYFIWLYIHLTMQLINNLW